MGSGRRQRPPPLCLRPCQPELPSLLEEGLLAGLFTPQSTPLLPSDGCSSALSECVLLFSLPAFCWPCSAAGSSQPNTSTFGAVGMRQRLLEKAEETFQTRLPPSPFSEQGLSWLRF